MHVMIAIPAYTGQIHLGTMRSLFTDLLALQARGDVWTLMDECGNGLIADARALIVAKFLASPCDTLVFIDSDVCWEAGALLNLLDKPVDCVAGIYPQRKDPLTFAVRWHEDCIPWADAQTLLVGVRGVPAGFLKLSRAQLEAMVKHYEDLWFYVEDAPDNKAWALFSDYWIDHAKLGEDYAFCARWVDMGGEVWIDPEMKMGHVGYKTFEGHLGDWLREPRDGL